MSCAKRCLGMVVLTLALFAPAAAQPALQLKGRTVGVGEVGLKRRNLLRKHSIVQFSAWPGENQLAELRRRDIKILGYVPDYGFTVSAADNTDFEGLGLLGSLPSAGKLSDMLDAGPADGGPQFAVVEFYPDVDSNDARAIVLDLELEIHESPELLANHLLVSGAPDQIAGLSQWDEVSYVFPASDELIHGIPVNACAGALTDQGAVGQSVLKVGDGWDGPGLNGADLNYAFINKTAKLPVDSVSSEVARAFAEWAKHAKLTFTPTSDPGGNRTIAVLFGSRSHGDPYPFDGPGGILAHTFYPYPVNPEPMAGDLHFDADENWHIGPDVDLFSVALHEAGHALGLGHSDKPGAVMYPYYQKASGLTDEDVAAVLQLYAAQDRSAAAPNPLTLTVQEGDLATSDAAITLHGTSAGGSGTIAVSWASDHGVSGSASGASTWTAGPIALSVGINTITVRAKDAQQTQVARNVTVVRQAPASAQPGSSQPASAPPQPPQLAILSPVATATFNTSSSSVTLSGTASDGSGIARVTWSNSRGGSGQASGTSGWNTGSITLQTGVSTITITVYAQSGLSTAKTLQITYTTPASGNSSAPPTLAITSPALTSISTSASSIAISGTAHDNSGAVTVTWTNSTGGSGIATGSANWSTGPVPLLVGTNTITIRATNAGGGSAWRAIVATRQ